MGETRPASHGTVDMQHGEFNSILTQASPSTKESASCYLTPVALSPQARHILCGISESCCRLMEIVIALLAQEKWGQGWAACLHTHN